MAAAVAVAVVQNMEPAIRSAAVAVALPRFASNTTGVMTSPPQSLSRLAQAEREGRAIRATTPTGTLGQRVVRHRSADTRKRQAVVVGQAARPLRRQAERLQA